MKGVWPAAATVPSSDAKRRGEVVPGGRKQTRELLSGFYEFVQFSQFSLWKKSLTFTFEKK